MSATGLKPDQVTEVTFCAGQLGFMKILESDPDLAWTALLQYLIF